MLKIFLSSTFRDLKDTRSEILNKLDSVFKGVTNINREVVHQSYNIDNPTKIFKELIDTGMLTKKGR